MQKRHHHGDLSLLDSSNNVTKIDSNNTYVLVSEDMSSITIRSCAFSGVDPRKNPTSINGGGSNGMKHLWNSEWSLEIGSEVPSSETVQTLR